MRFTLGARCCSFLFQMINGFGFRGPGSEGKRRAWKRLLCAGLGFLLVAAGCADSRQSETVTLLTVGSRVVTVDDFNRSYNLMLAGMREAEPFDFQGEREVKIRLLKQLTEEAALLEKASDSGILLTVAELEEAVQGIRKDYPEDTFDQMLIENAIPYADWEKELEKRLIIDKLLRLEVFEKVQITEEELAAFYREKQDPTAGETPEKDIGQESLLVEKLRRNKAEALMGQLMDAVRKAYPADVNETVFRQLLDKE